MLGLNLEEISDRKGSMDPIIQKKFGKVNLSL